MTGRPTNKPAALAFQEVTPEEWRIVAHGRDVGVIGRETIAGWTGWIAEWRHFALEFATLDEARCYVAADLNGGQEA